MAASDPLNGLSSGFLAQRSAVFSGGQPTNNVGTPGGMGVPNQPLAMGGNNPNPAPATAPSGLSSSFLQQRASVFQPPAAQPSQPAQPVSTQAISTNPTPPTQQPTSALDSFISGVENTVKNAIPQLNPANKVQAPTFAQPNNPTPATGQPPANLNNLKLDNTPSPLNAPTAGQSATLKQPSTVTPEQGAALLAQGKQVQAVTDQTGVANMLKYPLGAPAYAPTTEQPVSPTNTQPSNIADLVKTYNASPLAQRNRVAGVMLSNLYKTESFGVINPKEQLAAPSTPTEQVAATIGTLMGMVFPARGVSGIVDGILGTASIFENGAKIVEGSGVLSKADTVAQYLSKVPWGQTVSSVLQAGIKGGASFATYNQLENVLNTHITTSDRLKSLLTDAVTGFAIGGATSGLTGITGTGAASQIVRLPASFMLGAGLAKLGGANWQSAVLTGSFFALLEMQNTTPAPGKALVTTEQANTILDQKAIDTLNKYSGANLTYSSSQADINAAWKEALKTNHPDVGGTQQAATELNAAHDLLTRKTSTLPEQNPAQTSETPNQPVTPQTAENPAIQPDQNTNNGIVNTADNGNLKGTTAVPTEPAEQTTPAIQINRSVPTSDSPQVLQQLDKAIVNYQKDSGVYTSPTGEPQMTPALSELSKLASDPTVMHHTQIQVGLLPKNPDGTITLYRGGTPSDGAIGNQPNRLVSAAYDLKSAQNFVSDQPSDQRVIQKFEVQPSDIKVFIGGGEAEVLVPAHTVVNQPLDQTGTGQTVSTPTAPQTPSDRLVKYYKSVDTPELQQAWYEVMSELEVAAPGKKLFNQNGEFTGSQSSTFPGWLPSDVRKTSLLQKTFDAIKDPTKLNYPPASMPARRALFDAILGEIDARAGTDSSNVLEQVKETNASQVQGKEKNSAVTNDETADHRSAQRNPSTRKEVTIPKELQPLAEEAKKYPTAEAFVKALRQDGLMDLSNRNLHRFDRLDTIAKAEPDELRYIYPTVKEVFKEYPREVAITPGLKDVNPNAAKVTIYRSTLGKTIEPGDYVSFDRSYAATHIRTTADKVIKQSVSPLDVRWQGNDMAEWIYAPQKTLDVMKNLDFKDFYNQVNDTGKAVNASQVESSAAANETTPAEPRKGMTQQPVNIPEKLPPIEKSTEKSTFGLHTPFVKLMEEDLKPKGGLVKDTVSGIYKEIATTLNPLGSAPMAATDIVMKNKGEYERQLFKTEKAYTKIADMWDKQPESARLSFMAAIEDGSAHVSPELKALADMYRTRMNNAYAVVSKWKEVPFLENFFPHFWTKPDEVAKGFVPGIQTKGPLQGTKSFLKHRVFADIQEGLAFTDAKGNHPYKLVTSNPERLVQLFEQNVAKFDMAQNIKQDMIKAGMWKFVKSGDKAPTGWAPINDSVTKVYYKPTMTEYYDQVVMDKLNALADSLGITHERTMGAKGFGQEKAGISFTGENKVMTKFASPEEVLIHELGHQIDGQYHLQGQVLNNPTFNSQLNALARERMANPEEDNKFTKYVTSAPEKMAVMFESYLHAPDIFKEKAPDVYKWFEDFMGSHSELAPILDIKPSLVLGTNKVETGAFQLAGEYYANEGGARIINNYLSRNKIQDSAIGKGLMYMKNTMNAFELGFSGFHITAEALNSMYTKFGNGLIQLTEGHPIVAMKLFAQTPIAPYLYFKEGQKFYSNQSGLSQLETDIFTGGAKLAKNTMYKNNTFDTFKRNLREGNLIGATFRAPMAAIEAVSKPIFDYYVPYLKVGAFREMMAIELQRRTQEMDNGETTRAKIAREIWANVENRFGMLNYDNLFWNGTVKGANMMLWRAVGWNLGDVRELGGGFSDTVKMANDIRQGKQVHLTQKQSFLLSLLFLSAALGGIYQFLHTGKTPGGVRDLYEPQNGAFNTDGTAQRIVLPTYLKDLYSFYSNPKQTVANKLSPEFSAIVSILQNQDYYKNYVYNPNDNLPVQSKQVALYLINQFQPFSIGQIMNQRTSNTPLPQQVESFFGILKAPKDISQADWQKTMGILYDNQMGGHAAQTPEQQYATTLKQEARRELQKGDTTTLNRLIQLGILNTPRSVQQFVRDASMSGDQRMFKGLSIPNKQKVLQAIQQSTSKK
jgi:hypothetical protein